MLNKHQISRDSYITPTPSGAYFCASSYEDTAFRKILSELFKQYSTTVLNIDALLAAADLSDETELFKLLHRMQALGWLNGLDQKSISPKGRLEEILPHLLIKLSNIGKVLLADDQGFYLGSQGLPHETVEELSALSADLFLLYDRHQRVLKKNLSIDTSAWAIVDASGNGKIGFWPLWIGKHRFVLIVQGAPRLNQPAFMTLVWALSIRYGE